MRLRRFGDQLAVRGDSHEVLVRGEQRETVLTTGCRNQKVDRTRGNAFRPAHCAESCRSHVGPSIDIEERKGLQKSKEAIELLR